MGKHREEKVRIQKLLAQMDFGSRREIERWISEGRLEINGEVAKLGDRMSPSDQVRLDGRMLRLPSQGVNQARRVLLYHKPLGELCTRSDPEGRPTIFDSLPKLQGGRWISVGRLDINTSGLLLLTNDGELAHRLMHPSSGIQREYSVRVLGDLSDEVLHKATHGVDLEDGPARFEEVVVSNDQTEAANRWVHVVVMQGRHRLVRRLWEALGLKVNRLCRVRFGPIFLPRSLRVGRCMELDASQVHQLVDAVSK